MDYIERVVSSFAWRDTIDAITIVAFAVLIITLLYRGRKCGDK